MQVREEVKVAIDVFVIVAYPNHELENPAEQSTPEALPCTHDSLILPSLTYPLSPPDPL